MVENMLFGIEVRLGEDFLKERDKWEHIAKKIVYTGTIDEYFDYCYGALSYRSLRFETEVLEQENFQGVAGMNYTDRDTPYTRIVEHKHFDPLNSMDKTVITKEYPKDWKVGDEPYYPINNDENKQLYQKYVSLAEEEKKVCFGGRLGLYQYLDMDKVISYALKAAGRE